MTIGFASGIRVGAKPSYKNNGAIMKIQLNDLSSKVTEYAMTKLAPSAKSWGAKFAIGCFLPDVPQSVEKIARMSGSVDAAGSVDIDRLKTMIMSGFKTAGHVDLLGGMIGFDYSDAESLFSFLEGQDVRS